jgi:hypothetical protein
MAIFEISDDQIILGGVVTVEGHLANAGLGGDGIHADGAVAILVKELRGSLEEFVFGGSFDFHAHFPLDTIQVCIV